MTDPPPDGTRWMRYVWLVYLVALFFQPALDPESGVLDWVAVVVLIGVFLPLYVAGYRAADGRQLVLIVGATAGLGLAGSLINGGASVFIIYAAAAAAYLEPVRRAVLVIAALIGVVGLMMAFSPVPLPWRLVSLAPAFVFTIVTGAANLFDAERERAQRRLRRADEEIERFAALAERERIARDLHDLLGHTLSLIVVKSELAARLAEKDPARAGDEMREVELVGREALAEVRVAVVGYRAQGLRGELDGARRALAAAGVESTVDADLPALPIAFESALAFVLRESVTNVVRHADARHVTIRIGIEGSRVVLEVADDGRGGTGPEGAGLTGIRERIAALGGAVTRDGESACACGVTLPVEGTQNGRRRAAIRIEWSLVTIHVVLAEDQRMMLGALSVLLGLEDDLTGSRDGGRRRGGTSAADAAQPGRALDRHRDARSDRPRKTSCEIRRRGIHTRVVILTTFARSGYLRRALMPRCRDWSRMCCSPTLAEAIRAVYAGGLSDRSRAGRGCLGGGRPADSTAQRRAAVAGEGLANAEIAHEPPPTHGDGAELHVGGDRKARRHEPRCRREACPRPRLAVNAAGVSAGAWTRAELEQPARNARPNW